MLLKQQKQKKRLSLLQLEFNLESTPEEKPASPASSGVSFDISGLGTPSTPSATDQNDPLVQSFPELVEVNEIELNLELAAQYIKLGAYDAAREILTEKEAEFSSAAASTSRSVTESNRILSKSDLN